MFIDRAISIAQSAFDLLHSQVHQFVGLDYPHGHWLINVAAVLLFVIAPAWTIWIAASNSLRWLLGFHRRRALHRAAIIRGTDQTPEIMLPSLGAYIMRSTARFQLKLIIISLFTLPTAWLLLEIPKHIINHALADASESGHSEMAFFGVHLDRMTLLFALCASYLAALSTNGLVKYVATRIRGRVSERLVRRLRLGVLRAAAKIGATSTERAHYSAVVVQEVEPIGYFGGSLVVVPVIQGGALLTSILFLTMQNPALALAALLMLPIQLTFLPGLQKRLNRKVRDRVHSTRALGGLLMTDRAEPGSAVSLPENQCSPTGSRLRRQMLMAARLEAIRVEISDLKGRIKGLYNYTSNLTPFFFFSIGGFLVVKGQLSLGALVAALAAYREISPALRELFDFMQNWSDAKARFNEVMKTAHPGRSVGRPVEIS